MAEVNFKRTGSKRLLKLADFLEGLKLKPGQFKMRNWAEAIKNGAPACGTAACAAGWAAKIPSFRRAGYCLVANRASGIWGQKFSPAVGRRRNSGALKFFFSVDDEGVSRLFGANNENSTKATAARIRQFVKRKLAS